MHCRNLWVRSIFDQTFVQSLFDTCLTRRLLWNTRLSPNVVCHGNFWLFILHICIYVCRDTYFSHWWLFNNIQSFSWGKNKKNILEFFFILDYFTAFNFLLEKKTNISLTNVLCPKTLNFILFAKVILEFSFHHLVYNWYQIPKFSFLINNIQ
jgi:hypothetical protein